MSEVPRPWWASDATGPEADAPGGEDPVVAHRAARRGWIDPSAPGGNRRDRGDGPRDSASDVSDDASHEGRDPQDGHDPAEHDPAEHDHADGDEADSAREHAAEVCGVCPLCILARSIGESRPELLGHLAEAARHLSAAVRTVVEPPDDGGDPSAAGEEHEDTSTSQRSGPRRIDLDP